MSLEKNKKNYKFKGKLNVKYLYIYLSFWILEERLAFYFSVN
jgi:hypothetical protein